MHIYVTGLIYKTSLKRDLVRQFDPFCTSRVAAAPLLSWAGSSKTTRKTHAGSGAFALLPARAVIVLQPRPAGKAFVLLTVQDVKD